MKKSEIIPEGDQSLVQKPPRSSAFPQQSAETANPNSSLQTSDLKTQTVLSGPGVPNPSLTTTDASAAMSGTGSGGSLRDAARLRALERTHDLVALHAMRLGQSPGHTMQAVLEPGNGTRISLELQRAQSGIDAQAVLHRGNFEFLNQHWPKLQERLKARGVHLAALQRTSPSVAEQTGTQHRGSLLCGRRPVKEGPSQDTITEFVFGGSMTESPATRRPRGKAQRESDSLPLERSARAR
jgi:hypothetical protein